MFTNLLAFDAFLILRPCLGRESLWQLSAWTGVSGFACISASNVAWTFVFLESSFAVTFFGCASFGSDFFLVSELLLGHLFVCGLVLGLFLALLTFAWAFSACVDFCLDLLLCVDFCLDLWC